MSSLKGLDLQENRKEMAWFAVSLAFMGVCFPCNHEITRLSHQIFDQPVQPMSVCGRCCLPR